MTDEAFNAARSEIIFLYGQDYFDRLQQEADKNFKNAKGGRTEKYLCAKCWTLIPGSEVDVISGNHRGCGGECSNDVAYRWI